jgi:hypothetical protein
MASPSTVVASIPIPSTSVRLLVIVGIHVPAGLMCVIAGAIGEVPK